MITLGITYYDCPLMLLTQLEYWKDYPERIKEQVRIIVVDDGSPHYPAEQVLKDSDMKVDLYRIAEDIPFNLPGARNLIMKEADPGWVLLTDIDHVLPWESLVGLLGTDLHTEMCYSPYRLQIKEYGMELIHRHKDTFLIEKEQFWNLGGYDERYTPYYHNGAIGMFRRKLIRNLPVIELNDVYVLFFGVDIISDASPLKGIPKTRNEKRIMSDNTRTLNFTSRKVIV